MLACDSLHEVDIEIHIMICSFFSTHRCYPTLTTPPCFHKQGKENIPPKELPPATDAVLSPGRAVAASGKAPARFDVAIDPSSKIASSSSSVHAAKRAAYNAMIPGPMFTGRPVAPVSSAPARAKTFLR